ncbi:MAG TPA: hypothetical protein V6D22_03205 [Candidatus Obscuribacterales bacterium]
MPDFIASILFAPLLPVLMFVGHGTVESNQLLDFRVDANPNAILLSGQSASSSEAITRVTTRKRHHELIVTVHKALCGIPHPLCPQRTWLGSLKHYRIPVDSDIDKIVLGKQQTVLWSRSTSN